MHDPRWTPSTGLAGRGQSRELAFALGLMKYGKDTVAKFVQAS